MCVRTMKCFNCVVPFVHIIAFILSACQTCLNTPVPLPRKCATKQNHAALRFICIKSDNSCQPLLDLKNKRRNSLFLLIWLAVFHSKIRITTTNFITLNAECYAKCTLALIRTTTSTANECAEKEHT